jgi:hypothetical protein
MVLMRRNDWRATSTKEIQKTQVRQDLWIFGNLSDVTLICDDEQSDGGEYIYS